MFVLEDTYWWFVARRRLILRLLRRFLRENGERVLLDLGCGTGATLPELAKMGQVVGCEPSEFALGLCRRRDAGDLIASFGERLALRPQSISGAVMADVLEHVERDDVALQEVRRVLRPGAPVVISVPAHRALWTRRDEALGHYRRYGRRELLEKVRAAGLDVVYVTSALWLLFPTVLLVRIAQRVRERRGPSADPPQVDIPAVSATANRLLIALHDVENWLASRVALPWGASLLVVARRPDER